MTAERIADYELLERIAVGGMAEIFLARKLGPSGFKKHFALKRVLPDLMRSSEYVKMFLEEARLSARLNSPGLVQVFEFGSAPDGRLFLVMEFVDGCDLAALLCQGALPVPLALHVADALCQTLGDIHEAKGEDGQPLGIVHRDVTPSNVLVSFDGYLKLADLGIAKAKASGARTEPGAIKGKLAYLSPEQARGGEVDARSDLYSLGLLLFEAFTGEQYLKSDSDAGLIRAAESPTFRAPSSVKPEVPRSVDELLRRALEPAREQRFPAAAFLRRAIAETGLMPDPAEARRQLGDLVRRTKGAHPIEVPRGPEFVATAPLKPVPARSRTELVEPEPAPEVRPRSLRIALGAALLLALVAGGLMVWGHSPEQVRSPLVVKPVEPTAEPKIVPAPAPDPRPSPDPPPVNKPTPTAPRVFVRAPQPNPKPVEPPAPAPEPAPVPPEPKAPDLSADREKLDAIDHALTSKGVLRADAPGMWTLRDELAASLNRGEPRTGDLESLADQVQKLTVDRAFINAKIARLGAKVAALPAADQQRLKDESQQALSLSTTGRYAEANRHLNAIASIVEP